MTGKQRILAAFRGERPDAVPFCPNIYQWFWFHHSRGTLPSDLGGARHPMDALRRLGADILARWDTQAAVCELYPGRAFSSTHAGFRAGDLPVVTAFNTYPPGKGSCRSTFESPHGTLTQTWTYSPDAGADYISEYWWKSWDQFPAVRDLLESRRYEFDAAAFDRWADRAEDDGIVMAHITQTPLKTFHWLAGPENASLFLLDHPAEMRELAAMHEERAMALVAAMVDHPRAEVFMSLENLDSPFYPPYFYRDWCDPFLRRAAALIHSRGKILAAHACGHTRVLLPLAGESGIDCLEGITPPPLGDVPLDTARRLSGNPEFTVNGGIDTPHLELRAGAESEIHRYTRDLFRSMGDTRRFIFASSCSTPVSSPWENMLHFRAAAREYGVA